MNVPEEKPFKSVDSTFDQSLIDFDTQKLEEVKRLKDFIEVGSQIFLELSETKNSQCLVIDCR